MRKIQSEDLAELLTEARFTPAAKRKKQVEGAERLLDIIEEGRSFDKEYPFDFVCYKITGFRPEGNKGHRLITGRQLAEDLRVFIWKLSGQVAPAADLLGEEVYTKSRLAKKLSVSTKTIDRWRKLGLRVRKFVFDDGRKKLGFLKSAVDKFLGENPELVEKAGKFTRLVEEQREQITKRAAALSKETRMSRRQIIRTIAAQSGRGEETIRCVLRSYEKSHTGAGAANLRQAAGQLNPAQAVEVERLWKQGISIAELVKRFDRNKSSIYRILKHRRVQAILAKKIEYVKSAEFFRQDAKDKILGGRIDVEQRWTRKSGVIIAASLRGHSLGGYLEGLKDIPTLNREQELNLFRQYNYLKYLVSLARQQIIPRPSVKQRESNIPSVLLNKIDRCLAKAEEVKRTIIEANLRLVVSIANKHTITGANLAELVSEGNVALVQAVEKFDYTRGFRFSTYAGWVISKDFAHRITGQRIGEGKIALPVGEFEEEFKLEGKADLAAVERARHDFIQVIRDNLEPREQYIIINHFGLEGTLVKKNRKTLKQMGDELGLSKERVRQIELAGLQKLRQSLSPEQFDLLTG